MSSKLFVAAVSLGLVLSRVPVFTHHSLAAAFDEENRITLKGTITKVELVNPHGWIYLDVRGADGKVANWAIVTAAPSTLWRRGLTKDDLRVGMAVVIEGHRAREKAAAAVGRILRLADQTELFLR